MMTYVISLSGKPLDPTHPAKARKLVRKGKANVLQVNPFTIQLSYETSEYTQDITLGIDSGYQHIGFSAVSEKKEHISGELHLLQGMTNRIEERRSYKRTRRGRLRYRQPRFDNRKRNEGWLAPSIQHKLDSHIRFIKKVKTLLPINNVIIEVANFDIQKIKNPDISGVDYQQGEQMGFWNVREYVLHRDHHKCQNPNCKNKAKEPILQVHHIVYRDNGGSDAPSNLITLCTKCHTSANHKKGKFLYEWQINKPKLNRFKDSTFMSMVRWRLAAIEGAKTTYGYITKNSRIQFNLEKTHYNDAYVIAGGSTQLRCEPIHYQQVRRNNRSLEKFFDAKYIDVRTGKKSTGKELDSGRRTRNKNENNENLRVYRGEKFSNGQRRIRTQRYFYQPNDLVKFEGQICRVVGTMNKGKSVKLDIGKSPNPAKLTPYKFAKGMVAI
ncbi:RNA-guided endonuclease IscB [Priestia megaterium]|uniref:RNA-guided endonuclease IscB n=1 Tax=Priestia megaterium TaxID=1404 RepID=UPI003100F20A